MSYLELILSDQPSLLRGLATGQIPLPSGIDRQPFDYLGFPPALIPLWYREGPIFFGIWQHWLVDRAPSLVKMSLEDRSTVREWGRTPEQLVRVLTLEQVILNDDGPSPECQRFAESCGISQDELGEIDRISFESGDDPAGLLALPSFRERAPAICFPDGVGYDGEFPTALLEESKLGTVCSLEISTEMRGQYGRAFQMPPWLRSNQDQKEIFSRLLDEGRYGVAWLSLNSNGWTFKDCRQALVKLAEVAENPGLQRVVDCWTKLNHERVGGF